MQRLLNQVPINNIIIHAQGGVRDCGLVLLREVKLALFLEARAGVALTQDLEGRPILGELLRDMALGISHFSLPSSCGPGPRR